AAAAAEDEEIFLDDTEEDDQIEFINIHVREEGGRVYSWRIKRSTSIDILYRLVRSRGCPEGRLHFEGNLLVMGKKLLDYGIKEGSTIIIQ
ncbi:hypothetical protein PFISCL1PPCAC_5983, partial [Pristionchus fissidentatus]